MGGVVFAFGAGAEFPGSGLGLLIGVGGRWSGTGSPASGRLWEHRIVYVWGEDSFPATGPEASAGALGWKICGWREAWPKSSCRKDEVRAGVGVWVVVVGRGGWICGAGLVGTVAAAVVWIFGLIIL